MEFSYSGWSKASAISDMAISLGFAVLFILAATYALGLAPTFKLVVGIVLLYYCSFVFLCRAFFRWKYWYVFRARYVVGDVGVSIDVGTERQLVRWDEIERAEYLPLVPLYRFWSGRLGYPIVLFFIKGFNPSVTRRYGRAAQLIDDKLRDRLSKRWIPV